MSSIRFELYKPAGQQHSESDGRSPSWLHEIRAVRSNVLFASGRRPAFGPAGQRFGDPCPHDHHSFHITARVDKKLVGCIRGRPLSNKSNDALLDDVMGHAKLDHNLAALQVNRNHCLEVSRLTVDAEFRASQIARQMVASIWAVSWNVGVKMIVCGVGTRDYQDRFLARLGVQPMPHSEPILAHAYDDHVRPMYAWTHAPGHSIAAIVREMHDHFFGNQMVPTLAVAV
jgi:hypothetical protein